MQTQTERPHAGPPNLVIVASLGGAAYVVVFAIVDALLEDHTDTSHQMLIRVVLVSIALLGALGILVYVVGRERAADVRLHDMRREIDAARLEGALLTMRELEVKTNGLAPVNTNLLTARERQVALLTAQGRTNREIAEALVITERTAATHGDHIRAKLGLRSRAEIVAWVFANGQMER
jgi:DNA-binding CsgD family transcriptional regulator